MPESAPLSVIYEDSAIVAVDKPAGLLSVPGRGEDKFDSVQTRVAKRFPGANAIHRLDMSTSGLMLVAKHKVAERHYKRQFEARLVQKTYFAITHGRLWPHHGVIDLPLIGDWPNRPKQKVCYEHGKPAQTDYQVVCYQPEGTRVRLHPYTGRSHQLRVHLSALGYPILGDELYDGNHPARPRLLLHAAALSLYTPEGELLNLYAPTPF
ncbi:pseudouridine synthase [Suttonella sp. R2A3]|uniref:pseudouridine synthase n=1 Tax=Suttonella sp. R2A3 TaxID=2908648 RepID=UPI002880A812|nr:pseudouridine synthase [Suttonella sp. R2A3]